MFGCDIRVYIPECAAEIRHALELAKQDGCDVIVGGYSVQQDAGLLGLPAILLRTGPGNLRAVAGGGHPDGHPRPAGAYPDGNL